MKDTFSVEEAKAATREHFNLSDADVDFIDESYQSQDFQEFDPSIQEEDEESKDLPPRFHGHSVSYGRANNGRFFYKFLSGRTGCDTGVNYAWQDEYNHQGLSSWCGGIQDFRHQLVLFIKK